ncbi:MAG TPA: hypothetical protein PKZ36_01605 [Candidatus Paceibacterota bacterium]|nr:hypothetical protein [Candidatus Paceibacterota bacterium]HPT18083.1 hypothetical protein [Candidatus Paceibacterota bacterium]
MEEKWDYNKIISNRDLFNGTVYTQLSVAIKTLEERQKDKKLVKKIEDLLNGDIPEPLKKLGKYGISTKQVATPNFDTKWFLRITEDFGLIPIFSEYLDDKFTSNNSFKHSLGVIHLDKGISKNGESQYRKINVVDFKKYDGNSLKNVLTKWGESLTSFHKRLFDISKCKSPNMIFYDASEWLKRNGGEAKQYYKKEMLLYTCHGILFENFLLSGRDAVFAKEILLPSLEEVYNLTGLKPLIVPIPPMDAEEEVIWNFYDEKVGEEIIHNQLKK